jgi:hypothetical protein
MEEAEAAARRAEQCGPERGTRPQSCEFLGAGAREESCDRDRSPDPLGGPELRKQKSGAR